MKNYLLTSAFSLICFLSLCAQAKTIELTPDFHKINGVNITEIIPFDLSSADLEFIAMSCYHSDKKDLPIYYRLKGSSAWGDWIQFDQQYEFVESSRSAYRTKPIVKTFSDIQFKTATALSSPLTVRFFLAGNSSFAAPTYSSPTISRSLNCERPEVCERDCWCPTCPVDSTPQITVPTHLIVHHSAGNNESENFAVVVESIWDFHVNTNGWDDIGYNWLVDPNGVLYSGRLDNYQGAHFSCINENTVGICVIGDYSTVAPSDTALATLVNVLAFEATDHSIDVLEESYHLTGDFILSNVAGHRDSSGSLNACSGTVCPGESFYPLLPAIRLEISELPCYNATVSSIEEERNLKVSVYPNPFVDQLWINSSNQYFSEFELVNVEGKSFGFVHTGQANDVSQLSPGVYFLLEDGELVDRLVKK